MRVVICGAGIAGLALARCLTTEGSDGTEVLMVDRAPGPREQGYMIDFFGPGYDAAEAMGVLPRIQELGYHVREASYRDERGRVRSRMLFDQFAKIVDGRLTSIMRPDLERALREGLSDRVEVRWRTSVEAVGQDDDGVDVTLTDGQTVRADLLVGADGIHSTVRAMVFGPQADYLRHLGFHTAAYVFDDPELQAELTGQFSLTDTVDRQLGCYALRDGRMAVFLVHRTDEATLPEHPAEVLRREYAGLGWIAPRALAACPPDDRVYYDQVAQIDMPSWHAGRVALIGDAAYAVSLLAGQGASMGITGGWLLADRLRAAGSVPAALAEYERLLRPIITEKQRVARDGVRWFIPASATALHVRRAALRLARLPVVDRFVAGVVAGKSTALVSELHSAGRNVPEPSVPGGS